LPITPNQAEKNEAAKQAKTAKSAEKKKRAVAAVRKEDREAEKAEVVRSAAANTCLSPSQVSDLINNIHASINNHRNSGVASSPESGKSVAKEIWNNHQRAERVKDKISNGVSKQNKPTDGDVPQMANATNAMGRGVPLQDRRKHSESTKVFPSKKTL
jgi:hypothetical protein